MEIFFKVAFMYNWPTVVCHPLLYTSYFTPIDIYLPTTDRMGTPDQVRLRVNMADSWPYFNFDNQFLQHMALLLDDTGSQ